MIIYNEGAACINDSIKIPRIKSIHYERPRSHLSSIGKLGLAYAGHCILMSHRI